MIKAEARPEIRPLTGIRGFAAGLVLVTHFFPLWVKLVPSLQWLALLSGRGFLGVDLFFILSGFILNYVYFDQAKSRLSFSEYRSFIWHRFVRIWPVHFATIILLLALVLLAGCFSVTIAGNYSFAALPFQLTMTHAWPFLPGSQNLDPYGAWTWNYPAWSISAEWFAYLLVFPAMWYCLKYLNGRSGISFLLGYLLLGVWTMVVRPMNLNCCNMVCAVTFEFMTGALLYNVFRSSGKLTRSCQRLATPVFIVLVSGLLFCPANTPLFLACVVLLFPVLLLGMTAETALISKLFATPPALWLGRISYSIYMTQSITQRILKVVLVPEHYQQSPLGLRLALLAGSLILILTVASAVYYFVENPSRAYLRNLAEGRAAQHE